MFFFTKRKQKNELVARPGSLHPQSETEAGTQWLRWWQWLWESWCWGQALPFFPGSQPNHSLQRLSFLSTPNRPCSVRPLLGLDLPKVWSLFILNSSLLAFTIKDQYKSAFSTNSQSRFVPAVLDSVLAPHMMESLFLLSSGKYETSLRVLEGGCVSSKSPSRVWEWDEGVTVKTES